MFCSPSSVASCPVVGNVFGLICRVFRPEITELATPSFGVIAALMLLCAVYCCWKLVRACWLFHVPAGSATFLYAPLLNFGASTAVYPLLNNVALLSVGSPFMMSTCGFLTFHALTQSTKPCPMRVPTFTLSKLT